MIQENFDRVCPFRYSDLVASLRWIATTPTLINYHLVCASSIAFTISSRLSLRYEYIDTRLCSCVKLLCRFFFIVVLKAQLWASVVGIVKASVTHTQEYSTESL